MAETTRYMPVSGTELMRFQEAWCWRCKRESGEPDEEEQERCPILTQAHMAKPDDGPAEWQRDETGRAFCTAFEPEVTNG